MGVLHQVEMATQSYPCLAQSTDVAFSGKGVPLLRRWSVSNGGHEEADSGGSLHSSQLGSRTSLRGSQWYISCLAQCTDGQQG